MNLKGIKLTGNDAREIIEEIQFERDRLLSDIPPIKRYSKEEIDFLKKCIDTRSRLMKRKTITEIHKLIEEDILTKEELLGLKNSVEVKLSSKLDSCDCAPDELW